MRFDSQTSAFMVVLADTGEMLKINATYCLSPASTDPLDQLAFFDTKGLVMSIAQVHVRMYAPYDAERDD